MMNRYQKRIYLLLFTTIFSYVFSCIPTSVFAACDIDPTGTYIEAEDFTGSDPQGSDNDDKFTLEHSSQANGGYYLKSGTSGSTHIPPRNDIKEYEVNFTETGTYYIWMRGRGYSPNSDSMMFTVDNDSWKAWNYGGHYNTWVWTSSMQTGSGNTISVASTGIHTIKIAMREDNSEIDGFYLTKGSETPTDATVPSGHTSLDPNNCSGSPPIVIVACQINQAGTYIEAEDFTGEAPIHSGSHDLFSIKDDNDANGGQALRSGSSGAATNNPENDVKLYTVNFPVDGTYYFWMRGEGYSGSKDSMFITVDNQTWKAWNFGGNYNHYVWTKSMQVGNNNAFDVTAGDHVIKIGMREDDSRIDGFFITTDGGFIPTDSTVPSLVTVVDPNNCSTDPLLAVTPGSIGATNFVGSNADPTTLTLVNTGASDLTGGTISSSAAWVSVSPTVIPDPLAINDSIAIAVSFATSALAAGSYSAEITFTSASATNSPLTVIVALIVKDSPSTASCGEVPLYAENLVSPAIMIQLDTSGSMSSSMYILASGENPATPDLSTVVQEIIDNAGWQSGNSMGFIISGSGKRRAWSYDGQANGAPKLYLTYSDNVTTTSIESRVVTSDDDVQEKNSSLNSTSTYLELGRSGNPVGLRFANLAIPSGATIESAIIKFVISSGDSTTTNLTINGADVGNFPSLSLTSLTTELTTASVAWNNIESWNNTMSRIDIAEDVLKEVFGDQSISWGFATWAGGNGNVSDSRSDDFTNYRIGCHLPDDSHMAALQDIADDGSASGYTPLAPTMNAGLDYFTSNREDAYYHEFFTSVTCQPRILVIVTDGLGNTGTDLVRVEARVNALISEGISVVAVGFGIDNAAQIQKIAELAQAAGKIDANDYLYSLHDEDSNGVGIPFLAQSREEFINALNSIVTNVKAQIFHGSAPAPTTSVDTGEVLLTSTFDASDWSGDVTSTSFDATTGQLSDNATWSAEDAMPLTYNPFIYDSAEADNVSNYTDSSLTGDNYICKPLGDIINSTPKIVSSPPFNYRFNGYLSNFKYNANVYNREHLVYVSANDGAVHAFSLINGVEKWRFYPDSVKAKLVKAGSDTTKDMCSPAYCHQFVLDGSPVAADIYDSVVGEWKTILLTGLGEGGPAYFNLDITYANDFTPSADPSDISLTPSKYLWEFNETDDSEIGLATSDPIVERIAVTGGSDTTWAAFMGSGPGVNDTAQLSKEAYVFGLSALDKSMLWKDASNVDTYQVKLEAGTLLNDYPSPLLAIEIEGDSDESDHIYTGNLYGDMFRISNIAKGDVPVVGKIYDSANSDRSTPIATRAGFAYAGDPDADSIYDIWLYFGTGKYKDGIDKVSSNTQYFFGLYDSEGTHSPYQFGDLYSHNAALLSGYALDDNGTKVDLTGDGIVDANDLRSYRSIDCSTPDCNSAYKSWVVSLYDPGSAPSERIVAKPLVVGGIVFFTTFIPDGNVCEGNGDAYLLALDWQTGAPPTTAVFDINQDNIFDESDLTFQDENGDPVLVAGIYLGVGKPSEPVLHDDILFVGTTGQAPKPIKVNIPSLNSRLKAWKQNFN